ncbi:MAG: undecaprenyl-phosphate glucose phosphotransferase [Ignavibacteriae bacterium]|nr:undecaprenyl-phosphate glucose phosphotransferase [Ignavibacteriota bacterium]
MTSSHINKARRGDFLIPFLTVVSDAIAIELAFLFSYWLRFQSTLVDYLGVKEIGGPPFSGYLFGSFFVTFVWLLLLKSRKMYGIRRNVTLSDEFINIVRVVSWGMLIVMSAAFFYREFSYSRIVFGFLWIASIGFVFVGRAAVQSLERRFYRTGQHLQQSIIIGNDALANQVYAELNRHPSFGFNIVGYFADRKAHEELKLASSQYLGPIANAPAFIRRQAIDLIFIALRSKEQYQLLDLIGDCEGMNVEFMMVPDVLDVLASDVKVRELQGIPFLTIKSIPFSVWGKIAKRTFDVVVSAALLIFLSPLWLLIAALVKLSSRGPVLFKQERLGMDGKRFTMYKFRSMRVNAESKTGPVWTSKGDPRRTAIGVIIRKTSLDEIPQLFNVLKGEMSIVGPRPERPYFVDQFKHHVPKYLDRHRVKTGMTGWAQVNGLRGDTSLEERIKYDLYYIENWSLAFDVKILLRTLRVALSFKEVQ